MPWPVSALGDCNIHPDISSKVHSSNTEVFVAPNSHLLGLGLGGGASVEHWNNKKNQTIHLGKSNPLEVGGVLRYLTKLLACEAGAKPEVRLFPKEIEQFLKKLLRNK